MIHSGDSEPEQLEKEDLAYHEGRNHEAIFLEEVEGGLVPNNRLHMDELPLRECV